MMNINRNNYESLFLLYVDRELNQADMQSVDHFLAENPDLQNEFSLLKNTVFSSSEMIFENKELLFRKEEKKRVIPMYWLRTAAAVAILLMGCWIVISQLTKNPSSGIMAKDQLANVNAEKKDDFINNKTKEEKPAVSAVQIRAKEIGITKTGETSSLQNNAADIQTSSKSSALNRKPGKNDLREKNSSPAELVSKKENLNVETGIAVAGVQAKNDEAVQAVNSDIILSDPKSEQTVPKSDYTVKAANVLRPGVDAESGKAAVAAIAGAAAMSANAGATESAAQSAKSQPAVLPVTEAIPGQADYAVLNDPENQNENAISLVALNEKNKAITGFFKKFTKRAPADERKKIRVSVFQFSY